MDIYDFSREKGIRMVKYLYREFDMFTESESINVYHLVLKEIFTRREFKNFFTLDQVR